MHEWIPRKGNYQGLVSPNKKVIIRWGGKIFLTRIRVGSLEFLVRKIKPVHEGWRDGDAPRFGADENDMDDNRE
jgi:hypothetical protein